MRKNNFATLDYFITQFGISFPNQVFTIMVGGFLAGVSPALIIAGSIMHSKSSQKLKNIKPLSTIGFNVHQNQIGLVFSF